MICLSFVQGRLSKKIGSKLQYFPINNWQNEISIAQKIGFKYIEWIVSDYSNPIFNQIFQKQILQLLRKNNIKISSISLDLLMREPLFKIQHDDLDWILFNLKIILRRFKIKRVNIPLEENSKVSNYSDFNRGLRIFEEVKGMSRKIIYARDYCTARKQKFYLKIN